MQSQAEHCPGSQAYGARERSETYRCVFETIDDLVVVTDSKGIIVDCNCRAAQVLGLWKEEMLGRTMNVLVERGCAEQIREVLRETLTEGSSRDRECRLVGRDGKAIQVVLNCSMVEYKYGEPLEVVWIIRDVMQLRQLEEKLAELDSAFSQSIDGIAIGDLEPRLKYVNKAFASMHGYSPDEMLGMRVADLHNEEQKEEFERGIQKIKTRGSWSGEIGHITKDGMAFPTYMSVTLLKDCEGKAKGILAVARDIGEQRRLEQKLRWSQKMEAVGRLAGGVAHDFNNILTVIEGNVYLAMMKSHLHGDIENALQEVLKASERAAKLTGQLLAFSRRQTISPRVIDLNEVLLNITKMLRRLIGEQIELVTLPADGLGRVEADPGQIEQVIFNLAVNARDAMPDGGKLIFQTADVVLDQNYAARHVGVTPGSYVMMAVTDTGHGMSEETKASIFEPFFTTKEQGKGTGLGLATCYGIVKALGGNIWVYSEPGKGTTFRVYLPKVEKEAGPLATRDDEEDVPAGKETVLLVEDEPSVRRLVARMLRSLGYRVLEAGNGWEALHVVEEMSGVDIDILVSDVVMPGMGGVQLARKVRSRLPDIKTLFLSGYPGGTIAIDEAAGLGGSLLEKPFCLAELARKLREAFDT
ncbi:MAG: PAS domain S-box protein [Deltaproteobacteria bacterium]|nr:PAS domain S-box protein [Deltaproteobacteria bacterium]